MNVIISQKEKKRNKSSTNGIKALKVEQNNKSMILEVLVCVCVCVFRKISKNTKVLKNQGKEIKECMPVWYQSNKQTSNRNNRHTYPVIDLTDHTVNRAV